MPPDITASPACTASGPEYPSAAFILKLTTPAPFSPCLAHAPARAQKPSADGRLRSVEFAAEDDISTDGVRQRPDGILRVGSCAVGMQTNLTEVMAEVRLNDAAGQLVD